MRQEGAGPARCSRKAWHRTHAGIFVRSAIFSRHRAGGPHRVAPVLAAIGRCPSIELPRRLAYIGFKTRWPFCESKGDSLSDRIRHPEGTRVTLSAGLVANVWERGGISFFDGDPGLREPPCAGPAQIDRPRSQGCHRQPLRKMVQLVVVEIVDIHICLAKSEAAIISRRRPSPVSLRAAARRDQPLADANLPNRRPQLRTLFAIPSWLDAAIALFMTGQIGWGAIIHPPTTRSAQCQRRDGSPQECR